MAPLASGPEDTPDSSATSSSSFGVPINPGGSSSDFAVGLDTYSILAGQPSLSSSIGNVVTKGIPLIGLSVVNSFANTAIDVGNFFGGTATHLKVEDELNSFGASNDYQDYYKDHSQGIEAAGLVAGSLLPGLAAVKGVSAAVKALYLAKAGYSTDILSAATGFLSPMKAKVLQDAMQEINAGNIFSAINADKLKAIALGFGDNYLQGVVYTAATAATMHASPLLEKMSFDDTVKDMFYGSVVPGLVGGGIEGIFTHALFNRAIVTARNAAQATAMINYLGKGAYTADQQIVTILHSAFEISETRTVLGRTVQDAAVNTGMNATRKLIADLVPGADPEVSNKFLDMILQLKKQATPTGSMVDDISSAKERVYSQLAGLAKVTRTTAAPLEVNPEQFTYINRPTPAEFKGGQFQFDDLFTDVPRYSFGTEPVPSRTYGTSQRFQFSDGISKADLKLSREGDPSTWDGTGTPIYGSAKAAFADGVDLHIGPNFRVVVNPESENVTQVARPGELRTLSLKEEKLYRATGNLPDASKPLLGAPMTLNVKTGAYTNGAVPTVGDFGSVTALPSGVRYGFQKFSSQSVGTPTTLADSATDASARYAWWAKRGVKDGDTILLNDIPALEQVAREWEEGGVDAAVDHAQIFKDRGIDFQRQNGEKVPIPASYEELLEHLKSAKDEMISSLTPSGKMSSQELSIRANVPEDYLANGMAAETSKDYRLPIESQTELSHVNMWYNVGNTNVQDGNILRGLSDVQYRVGIIKAQGEAAGAKNLGESWTNFKIDKDASSASASGAGSGFLSFANAAYKSLAGEAERVGRFFQLMIQHTEIPRISTGLGTMAQNMRANPELTAEISNFIAVRRRTSEVYQFLPDELAQKYSLAEKDGSSNLVVLRSALVKDRNGNIVDWNKNAVPANFNSGDHFDLARDFGEDGNFTYYRLSQQAADAERDNRELNRVTVGRRNVNNAASGLSKTIDPDGLYAPPVNTSNYSHFAYVRVKPGVGMGDSDVSIVTAASADDLAGKIANIKQMGPQYEVFTKQDLKDYHEVVGDYDWSRNFADTQTNTMLKRAGVLNNIFPATDPESIIKDYMDWHIRGAQSTIRDTTEIINGQLFAELKAAGQQYANTTSSTFGGTPTDKVKGLFNPYMSYVKTALGISAKENYRFLSDLNERAESYFSTAFSTAKSAFFSASNGKIPYEQAVAMSRNFGLGDIYGDAIKVLSDANSGLSVGQRNYQLANQLPPEKYLSKFVSMASSVLGNTVIKLDTFQQLIHIVSTPILMLAEANSARDAIRQLTTVEIPDGSGKLLPSATKLVYNGIGDYFDAAIRNTWMPKFKDWGLLHDPDTINAHFAMQDAITLPMGKFSGESSLMANASKAVELGRRLSGTNLTNAFLEFSTANIGRTLGEAAGLSDKALMDFTIQFSNRVKGNNIASQRPVAFQGPIGQAVGLFQTYQFNMMQQLFRYVQDGEGKTLAMLGGLQGSLFGLNSLPGFQAINNHIVGNAAGNPSHSDLYTSSYNLLDPKLGNWLLYGSLSNVLGAGLYTRGDMNPRNLTLLPVNPLNFPAIAGAIRFGSNLVDVAGKIAKGGDIGASLLMGVEHNGLSRPLSGIAQLAQGFSTTRDGKLIARTHPLGGDEMGYSEMASAANFSRLMGARPLDEATTMDAMYRVALYTATDNARVAKLGEAVRSSLVGNNNPNAEQIADFASEYAGAGGRVQNFSAKMHEWNQEANSSVANKVYRAMQNPRGKAIQQAMGGIPLPDFRNSPTPQPGQASGGTSGTGLPGATSGLPALAGAGAQE